MREKNREIITKSSRSFFVDGMTGHNAVKSITDLGDDIYLLERTAGRPDLKILVADIYIASEAEVFEINPNLLEIECIVLIGFYNQYSIAAKDLAKSMNVGLFDNKEFFGAVNFIDDRFYNYVKKEKK